jgi:hypothetical protein
MSDIETPEVEVESAPEVKPADVPTPKPKAPKYESQAPASEITHDAVISMSALSLDTLAKNSASVRWIQRRLIELGHYSAGSDLPGHLSAGTLEALEEYAVKGKSKGEPLSRATIEALFKGTPAKITS